MVSPKEFQEVTIVHSDITEASAVGVVADDTSKEPHVDSVSSAYQSSNPENVTLDPSILHSPPQPVIPSNQPMSMPFPPEH